jgi:FkbM family methyltransferase
MFSSIFAFFCLFASEPQALGNFSEYEKRPLDLVAQFLPIDPIIVEAGAYNGDDSLFLAQKWLQGKVFSFEPNPHAYEQFLKKTARIPNISGFNLALSHFNGTALFNICYGSTGDNPEFEGASSLLPASPWMEIHYQGPKIRVPCIKLDSWAEENHIDHIDFLWLDLEGMELPVLKSSPKMLSKVRVIYTETNFWEFRVGTTLYPELNAFLENEGFVLLAHWYIENFKGQGNAIYIRK